MTAMLPMPGSHALVTGGTGGLGGAVANALREAGCSVVATGLTEAEIASAKALGMDARQLNVSDGAAVNDLVGSLRRLDILVNAAGTIRRREEFTPEAFAQVLDVNLTGTMRLCTAAQPLLAKRGGAIVNVASLWSFFGGAHAPGYTASKGGVAQLTKSLAVAWAGDGIRVNAVAPGWIETAMTAPVRADP